MEIMIPFIFLAFFVMLISFILFLVIKNKKGNKFEFSSKNLLLFYLQFMTFVSLIAFAFGLIGIIKSGFAASFGADFVSQEFKYEQNIDMVCGKYPAPVVDDTTAVKVDQSYKQCIEEQKKWAKEQESRKNSFWKESLIDGIALFLIGGLFLLFHAFGLKRIEQDESSAIVNRLFLIFYVVFYGVGSIISLSMAIYTSLRYMLIETSTYYTSGVPGELLAVALVFTPIWLYFIKAFWVDMKREG